jgi:DNA-binding GntR family transcriptional regulator
MKTADTPAIAPLKKTTLASQVAHELRDLITRGVYEPGQQLNEVELAARFGVSRGPVREGLRKLVHEGLLRSEAHHGVFVPILEAKDVSDIYVAREAIELAALKVLAASDRRAVVVDQLRATIDSMRKAASAHQWVRVVDLDLRFHVQLVDAAGSPRLSRMYGLLIDETRAVLTRTLDYPGRELLVDQHLRVIESLTSGDEQAGRNALSQHFAESTPQVAARPMSQA